MSIRNEINCIQFDVAVEVVDPSSGLVMVDPRWSVPVFLAIQDDIEIF